MVRRTAAPLSPLETRGASAFSSPSSSSHKTFTEEATARWTDTGESRFQMTLFTCHSAGLTQEVGDSDDGLRIQQGSGQFLFHALPTSREESSSSLASATVVEVYRPLCECS